MRQVGEENVHNSRVKNLRNAAEILIQNGGVTYVTMSVGVRLEKFTGAGTSGERIFKLTFRGKQY